MPAESNKHQRRGGHRARILSSMATLAPLQSAEKKFTEAQRHYIRRTHCAKCPVRFQNTEPVSRPSEMSLPAIGWNPTQKASFSLTDKLPHLRSITHWKIRQRDFLPNVRLWQYGCHVHLKHELDFLKSLDRALQSVMEIVDMPNPRASLLIRLLHQNAGKLSKQ